MKPSLLFRILAWIVILFPGILAGCSGDALERTPSNPSKISQAAEHPTHTPGLPTPSPTAESSAIHPHTATPFSMIAPYRLIDPSEFSLEFTMNAPIPSGEYIVAAEETFTLDPEMHFQVMTFSGDVVSTLNVELINKSISHPALFATQIHADSNQLLIVVEYGGRMGELYVYNFQTSSTWGIMQ